MNKLTKLLLVFLFVAGWTGLNAQKRMSDEDIEELREEENLPKLFEMPFANRRRIYALFIKPVDTGRGIVLREIEKWEGRDASALDRSALIWLWAECRRIDSFLLAREDKDASHVRKLPAELLPKLLDAMAALGDGNEGEPLRRDIVILANGLLVDSGAASMPDELKRRVVSEYLPMKNNGLDRLPAPRKVSIYKNLGIDGELGKDVHRDPKTVEDMGEIQRMMKLSQSMNDRKTALSWAEEALARHGKGRKLDWFLMRDIAGLMLEDAPEKLLEVLPKYTIDFMELHVWLFAAAVRTGQPRTREACRDAWLEPYRKWMSEYAKAGQPDTERKTAGVCAELLDAMGRLAKMGFPEEALFLCQALDGLDEIARQDEAFWKCLRAKGMMQEQLGQDAKALETYRQCRSAVKCTDFYRRDIEKRIKRLETADEE